MAEPKPADPKYSLKRGHGLSRDEAKLLRAVLRIFKDAPPSPKDLLREATHQPGPAHSLFEWDTKTIVRQYFVDRAARLVGAIQVGPPKRRRSRKAKK